MTSWVILITVHFAFSLILKKRIKENEMQEHAEADQLQHQLAMLKLKSQETNNACDVEDINSSQFKRFSMYVYKVFDGTQRNR